LLCGSLLQGQDTKAELKDQPRQLEGTVKAVDGSDPKAAALTITVKELKPTDKEDMMQEVEKDYRFRVTSSTRVMGLDGKPAPPEGRIGPRHVSHVRRGRRPADHRERASPGPAPGPGKVRPGVAGRI